MLGGLLIALIPSLAVFAAIENPSRLQRNLTYVLAGLVVFVLVLFIGTTHTYVGWRYDRSRRNDLVRAMASPKIKAGMSAGVPYRASFRLVVPEGTNEGHQPPYTATIERDETSLVSVPASLEKNAIHINWPEGFDVQSPKLEPGRFLLTWRDEGEFAHEFQFAVNRHGFFRPKLIRHIPERLSLLRSMGDY